MSQTSNLRDLVELPGSYIYKIIVKPSKVNGDRLLALTENELGRQVARAGLRLTPSAKGNYHSYTLTLFLETFEELESLYQVYRELDGVVMVI